VGSTLRTSPIILGTLILILHLSDMSVVYHKFERGTIPQRKGAFSGATTGTVLSESTMRASEFPRSRKSRGSLKSIQNRKNSAARRRSQKKEVSKQPTRLQKMRAQQRQKVVNRRALAYLESLSQKNAQVRNENAETREERLVQSTRFNGSVIKSDLTTETIPTRVSSTENHKLQFTQSTETSLIESGKHLDSLMEHLEQHLNDMPSRLAAKFVEIEEPRHPEDSDSSALVVRPRPKTTSSGTADAATAYSVSDKALSTDLSAQKVVSKTLSTTKAKSGHGGAAKESLRQCTSSLLGLITTAGIGLEARTVIADEGGIPLVLAMLRKLTEPGNDPRCLTKPLTLLAMIAVEERHIRELLAEGGITACIRALARCKEASAPSQGVINALQSAIQLLTKMTGIPEGKTILESALRRNGRYSAGILM